MPEATIHLLVPAATKGRWIRASREAGLKLTDWIVNAVEEHMQEQRSARITIPKDVHFADLNLSRNPIGGIRFSWQPLERICAESGLNIAILKEQDEGNVAELLSAWYTEDRKRGGPVNDVMEQIIAEAKVEHAQDEASATGKWRP